MGDQTYHLSTLYQLVDAHIASTPPPSEGRVHLLVVDETRQVWQEDLAISAADERAIIRHLSEHPPLLVGVRGLAESPTGTVDCYLSIAETDPHALPLDRICDARGVHVDLPASFIPVAHRISRICHRWLRPPTKLQ